MNNWTNEQLLSKHAELMTYLRDNPNGNTWERTAVYNTLDKIDDILKTRGITANVESEAGNA